MFGDDYWKSLWVNVGPADVSRLHSLEGSCLLMMGARIASPLIHSARYAVHWMSFVPQSRAFKGLWLGCPICLGVSTSVLADECLIGGIGN